MPLLVAAALPVTTARRMHNFMILCDLRFSRPCTLPPPVGVWRCGAAAMQIFVEEFPRMLLWIRSFNWNACRPQDSVARAPAHATFVQVVPRAHVGTDPAPPAPHIHTSGVTRRSVLKSVHSL